ncbi:hypothetical protein AN958_05896 [Leucoagaricus sp. SymC.cos]|nr:hypothetical protein AN958_05896 [Leucoagaricus sp. SymC.cos]
MSTTLAESWPTFDIHSFSQSSGTSPEIHPLHPAASLLDRSSSLDLVDVCHFLLPGLSRFLASMLLNLLQVGR